MYNNAIMKNLFCKMLLIGAAASVLPLLSSCALVDRDKSILSPSMWSVIDTNRENLSKLRVGMTKKEVRNIMGEPMSEEVYNTSNHWFYYTRTRWSDGMATRDECTPLVFDEFGILRGWGTVFYKDNYNLTAWSEQSVEKVLK